MQNYKAKLTFWYKSLQCKVIQTASLPAAQGCELEFTAEKTLPHPKSQLFC